MASDFETVIAKCDGCKHEEECREMPPCILDAYNKGRADATKELPTSLYYDGFNAGYKKGRSDKQREITSAYMLLTEKQVAEIRADAIDEFADMLTNDWGLDIIIAQSNRAKLKSFIISNAEQLKEQKNDDSNLDNSNS